MKDIIDKCDVVLDANDPDFAEQFAEAIGAKPGETVEIITPQFTRTDGVTQMIEPIGFEETDEEYTARLEAEVARLEAPASRAPTCEISETDFGWDCPACNRRWPSKPANCHRPAPDATGEVREATLLADRLRWIFSEPVISLALAEEVCGKLDQVIHFLDKFARRARREGCAASQMPPGH